MTTSKVILHIDMNSYFASVEQQANPCLRGKAVGVCEHLGGIIIAPSVEAKRKGISLGTPVWEAKKIDPQIVFLYTDPEKYRTVTDRFLNILRSYTDDVERYSIDEAFLDISDYCNQDWNSALMLGLEIKQRIKFEVGEWISCSIGIGPNKLVSKIAADLDGGALGKLAFASRNLKVSQLDRICLVRPDQIEYLYDLLELRDVPGIGKGFELALKKMKIYSLRDLSKYSVNNLINRFGINGYFLHRMARFCEDAEIVSKPVSNKSIGHAYTLPKEVDDVEEIRGLFMKLSEKIGRRMRMNGARGNIINLFFSDRYGNGFRRSKKIKEFIMTSNEIYRYAWNIFQESHQKYQRVKIAGVAVSGLDYTCLQEPLLEQFKRPFWLTQALDKINNKYGEFTVFSGLIMNTEEDWARDSIGFGQK